MHPIIGLVGPSGSGKSTLIIEAVRLLPERLGVLLSLTTRPKRGPEDDLFYHFVTVEEMRKREQEGSLIQISEYAGNLYANDRADADRLLNEKCGINAYVQEGVQNLRGAGYKMLLVHVVPEHQKTVAWVDEARKNADRKRFETTLEFDLTIHNSFEMGGKERAITELLTFIRAQD